MGRKKKIIGAVVSDEMQNFIKDKAVVNPKFLSGSYIMPFVGDTYEHSIKLAFEWVERKNNQKDSTIKFELVNYFPQQMNHKAILVSYNVKL